MLTSSKTNIKYTLYNSNNNFDEWDSFIKNCARGHYSQYSSYLKSYLSYGADYKIIIATQNNKIIAGIGFILLDKFGFKISSVPAGPIISVNYEYLSVDLINEAINYCFENKYIFLQITTLSHKDYAEDNLLPYIDIPNDKFRPLEGTPFRLTPIPNQFFYVNLKTLTNENTWEENMLKGFGQEGRRRIKKAKEHNLIFKEIVDVKDIKVAYSLFVVNAKLQGYKTRSWEDYKETMLMQIKKKQAYLFTVSINNKLICAHYGIIAGNSYFYTLGGTKRTDIDYSVGHFIHWNIIKFAKSLNLDYYDFGSNGTKGVLRFKKSFKPTKVIFDKPIFYVFSPIRFFFLKMILPIVKKYKSQFAYLMKKLK